MKLPGESRQSQQGTTLPEVLIAGLLLAIGMMALVNVWLFSFGVTTSTDKSAIAYNLGRFAMERVKMSGFNNAAEGSNDVYYDGNENQTTQSSSTAKYKVNTTIVSSAVTSGTIGQAGAVPDPYAYRSVDVTVTDLSNSSKLYESKNYLVRAGI